MSEPYRTADGSPLFVCIVCFRQLDTAEGTCPRCAAPLLSVDDPEVVDELRKHARRVLSRLERTQMAIVGGGAGVVAAGFFLALLVTGVYDIDTHSHSGYYRGIGQSWPFVVSFGVLFVLFASAYPKVFKGAAAKMKFDPDEATVPNLLGWLGLDATKPSVMER